MAEIYRLWRPCTQAAEKAQLITEIMTVLSVYGFGALPSDPVQSKAKVNGFCKVLEEFPLWAIQETGTRWLKEEKNPPTPTEWAANIRQAMGYYARIKFGQDFLFAGKVYEKLTTWLKTTH